MRAMLKLALPVIALALAMSCAKSGEKSLTWAVGKDPTGRHQALIEEFQRVHPGVRVNLLEMPESSSAQHDAYVTYLAAGDRTIDVYSIDIIWPAEFAQAGWLLPLDDVLTEKEDFLPGPLAGCTYRDTLWAVPWFTDAGMLYYRSDLLKKNRLKVPVTWEELIKRASFLSKKYGMVGYAWQGQQYEGLVCNFLEVLWSCGGELFDDNGQPLLASREALQAAGIVKEMFNIKASPLGVLTYKEEESRQLFTSGQAVFMRNWPYAWALSQDTTKGSVVAGKVGMAPLPACRGESSSSCLGGWNLAVSRFSRHPALAKELVLFLTSAESQKEFALKGGRLPTRKSVYHDQKVLEANPHYRDFYCSFITARPRPVRPDYSRISDFLQIGLHRIFTGQVPEDEGLLSLQEDLKKASVID
ncbi:TPA: ABC transporter substrate-binding protein [Candidatus Edwardsbacteria bacterium]|nr:ABC transporter substrate-binding protein [Candidatus Edwardsbacteria bacterium]HBZ86466.1 ABC transporter substrate-binding protein [Candidatus Edwardsbacteria bacterium]